MTDTHDSELSLNELARKIEEHTKVFSDNVVRAASYLSDLRRRIKAGEAGAGVDWRKWAQDNVEVSESRLRELMFIADSDDPVRALLAVREKTRRRVERHREKQAAALRQLGVVRKRLIAFIKTADEQKVQQIFRLAFPNDALGPPAAEVTSTSLTGSSLH